MVGAARASDDEGSVCAAMKDLRRCPRNSADARSNKPKS
jgi:hypothetical protein